MCATTVPTPLVKRNVISPTLGVSAVIIVAVQILIKFCVVATTVVPFVVIVSLMRL